jgi:hypothetical protein
LLLNPIEFGSRLRDVAVAALFEMEAVKKMWEVIGTGLYVCFCVLNIKQRHGVSQKLLLFLIFCNITVEYRHG